MTESSTDSRGDWTNRLEGRSLNLLLVLLALSTILDGLDASIVNVALPVISDDFGISIGDSSWVTLVYVVALASLLLPLAKLAENGLVKRTFFWGVVAFTGSSIICGISADFFTLVVFRLTQGVGAALMTAAVPVLITTYLPSDRKGLGMGVLAVASGVSIVLGPSVGGIITDVLSWHWIFLINVPFGIIAALMTLKILPPDEGYDRAKDPDMINTLLIIFGIGSGIVCLQNTFDSVLPYAVVAACGAISIIFMSIIGHRMVKHPDISLISSELLKRRDFQILSIAFLMTCMIIMGTQYVLPYFLQIYGNYTVSESGYLLSLASIFAIVLSIPVGRWCDTRGCKVPSILAGVGRFVFCVIFLLVVLPQDLILLLLGLVVMGCSMAFAGTGLSTALIHHADDEQQADAATFMLEVNYVAASLGVVLYSVIFQFKMGVDTVETVAPSVLESAFDLTMLVGCVLSIVAIICASVVKNIIPKKSDE